MTPTFETRSSKLSTIAVLAFALAALAVLASGCSSDGGAGSGMTADLGGMTASGPKLPGAYGGTFSLPVKTQLAWSGGPGEGPIEALQIVDGVGTLRIAGADYAAVAYSAQDSDATNWTASVAATTATGPVIVYAACEDGVLTGMTVSTLRAYTAQQGFAAPGSCAYEATAVTGSAQLTAPGDPLTYGPAIDPATIHGERIDLDGGVGRLSIQGVDYDLKVFNASDYSEDGYWLLDVTLRKDETLAYAAIFLQPAYPNEVAVAYGFRFDQPAPWPKDGFPAATWSLK